MGRPRTPKNPKDPVSAILSENLEERIRAAYPKILGETDRYKKLAAVSGVGKETIRSIVKGERSARVDILAQLAAALSTTVRDLFDVPPPAHKAPFPNQAPNLTESDKGENSRSRRY